MMPILEVEGLTFKEVSHLLKVTELDLELRLSESKIQISNCTASVL